MKRVKEGAKWTWSALRPGAVIGFSLVGTSACHSTLPPPESSASMAPARHAHSVGSAAIWQVPCLQQITH